MNPTKYLVKFRLEGDPEDVAYRTLTFVWKLSFNAACSRITNLIENRYGRWRIVKVEVYSSDERRTHLWV